MWLVRMPLLQFGLHPLVCCRQLIVQVGQLVQVRASLRPIIRVNNDIGDPGVTCVRRATCDNPERNCPVLLHPQLRGKLHDKSNSRPRRYSSTDYMRLDACNSRRMKDSTHLLRETTPVLAKSSERYAVHELDPILPSFSNGHESRACVGDRLCGFVWGDRVCVCEHGGELDGLLPEGIRSYDGWPGVR